MIGAVTAGRFVTQLRATWLGVAPIFSAILVTVSRVAQFWSFAVKSPKMWSYSAVPEPPLVSVAAEVSLEYLPVRKPLASGDHGRSPTLLWRAAGTISRDTRLYC